MAYRKTLQIGDPKLKKRNIDVTDFKSKKVKQIIEDLTDTMRKNELVGMSGSQIGYSFNIFITEPRKTPTRTIDQTDKLRIYINPKITKVSKTKSIIYEGCGSVMDGNLFGPVERPKVITVEAFNEKGKKFQLTCDGILSRVIQHEYDHLIGIEFTEKISDYSKLMSKEFYIQYIKKSPTQIANSKITLKEFKYL